MRFLEEQACAAAVDRRDPRLLKLRLGEFMSDADERRTLAARALQVARSRFDAQVVRDHFRAALLSSAEGFRQDFPRFGGQGTPA
jgi:hypothetical protein